jgi:hypothetical protein
LAAVLTATLADGDPWRDYLSLFDLDRTPGPGPAGLEFIATAGVGSAPFPQARRARAESLPLF